MLLKYLGWTFVLMSLTLMMAYAQHLVTSSVTSCPEDFLSRNWQHFLMSADSDCLKLNSVAEYHTQAYK